MASELETKIQKLRTLYSFDQDKKMTLEWETKVREMMVRAEASKLDGVKDLIAELEKMIRDISSLLAWDNEMTQEQRNTAFVKRECYLWLFSFFNDPEKVIKNITAAVEEELN